MDSFLHSKNPNIIVSVPKGRGSATPSSAVEDDTQLRSYLTLRKPTVLVAKPPPTRFTGHQNAVKRGPVNRGKREFKTLKEAYEPSINGDPRNDQDYSDEDNGNVLIIPPLNTDIRITTILPEFQAPYFTAGQQEQHNELLRLENFSWHLISKDDSSDVIAKKKLMAPVQNQHMCGSCWAMALASCMSDCFVVAGKVSWMPKIAPTYLMMTIPQRMGNSQCNGGNPAAITLALETLKVADMTCIDYSWCENDIEACTSASAANHFGSTLGRTLNSKIPKPPGACYFGGERYMYQIDSGSEALSISGNTTPERFRDIIKQHLVEFGPPLAGYAVLKNFITGNFTDPNVNQGVYFDRAYYPSSISSGQPLAFSNVNASEANLTGLHAVEIVGWGVARSVQYDTDKYGDVPYWWAKNSWGANWGNANGYFKMAMYPWNKYSQFGQQIGVKGSVVGGMILVRCTSKPVIEKLATIDNRSMRSIVRSKNDDYYRSTPKDISGTSTADEGEENSQTGVATTQTSWIVYIGIGIVVIFLSLLLVSRTRN